MRNRHATPHCTYCGETLPRVRIYNPFTGELFCNETCRTSEEADREQQVADEIVDHDIDDAIEERHRDDK